MQQATQPRAFTGHKLPIYSPHHKQIPISPTAAAAAAATAAAAEGEREQQGVVGWQEALRSFVPPPLRLRGQGQGGETSGLQTLFRYATTKVGGAVQTSKKAKLGYS